MERYFEDFALGQRFEHGSVAVTVAAIAAFLEYDPQPFHRPETAKDTRFGRVVASGWQTAAYTMRLMVDGGLLGAGGGIGLGADELRWVRPVYPGDELSIVAEVESLRALPEKNAGIVRLQVRTRNQHGEDVMTLRPMALVACRDATEPSA